MREVVIQIGFLASKIKPYFNIYLEPAVEWVRRNHPQIKITVYIPVLEDERHLRRNDNYHRMGVTCKPLPLTDIPRHVLPATVRVNENETVTRPVEWV